MAILVNGSGNYLSRTASPPDPVLVTGSLWLKMVTGENGVGLFEWQGVACEFLFWTSLDAGASFGVWNGTSSVGGGSGINGVWYHVAFQNAGGTNGLKIWVNGSLMAQHDGLSTPAFGTFQKLWVGADHYASVSGSANFAALKIWDAALTLDEIEKERWQYLPNRLLNLHLFSPFINTGGTSFLDISGNGRNWTEAGTVTDADGPPIPWKMGRHRILIPAAAAAAGSIVPLLLYQYRARRA